MKRTFLAAMVAAVVCAGTDASAQKKAKKSQLVLDGTVVNVNPLARTSPVEEKLKAKNTPGIEYAPTKTVYLYPKGQGVDQGIVENGVAVTQGPLVSNGLEGAEVAGGWGIRLQCDGQRAY